MPIWGQIILTFACSLVGCAGFWKFLERRSIRKDAEKELLVGLGHDRIVCLGLKYVEQKYITKDEYENLKKYLFEPYTKCDGNGSAARVMAEVEKLPIRESKYSYIVDDDESTRRR